MDVQDILSFQPNHHVIRPGVEKDSGCVLSYPKTSCVQSSAEPIPKQDSTCDAINGSKFRRLSSLLEKRFLKNQELRIKFSDQAKKFLESELELFEVVQELSFISTTPEFLDETFITRLFSLIYHDNVDLVLLVIEIVNDIVELGSNQILEMVIDRNICPMLMHFLEKLEHIGEAEANGVNHVLSIFETLIEVQPGLCETPGLLVWLLKCIMGSFDEIRQYAAELLAICLQNSSDNRLYIGETGGLDLILQRLSRFKREDPTTAEEWEMMENLFDCLCSFLLHPVNKTIFHDAEGIQLMNLMLKERRCCRSGALRVLDCALSPPNSKENCDKFIDILGLRTIFPLFMKIPKKLTICEEHIICIVSYLLRFCEGVRRKRILNKFLENDYEKVDRLLELHFKYLERVNCIELDRNALDDELYLTKLDNGLFPLQAVDYIILEISSKGKSGLKQRIIDVVNIHGGSLMTIKHVMREYAGNLGDAGGDYERKKEEKHVLHLIDMF